MPESAHATAVAKPPPAYNSAGVNLTWQDAVVVMVVLATVGAFLRAHQRRKRRRFAGGCGCGDAAAGGGVSVTYRQRRGERPQVIIRSGRAE
jgi:hypothetical protein